jgi:hypothetical protein
MVIVLMSCLTHDGPYPGERLYSAPGRALQGLSSFTYHLFRYLAQHLCEIPLLVSLMIELVSLPPENSVARLVS